jgi:hypothetical protein
MGEFTVFPGTDLKDLTANSLFKPQEQCKKY